MIATRQDIDSMSYTNDEIEDPDDICGLNCWFCIVLDTSMDQ